MKVELKLARANVRFVCKPKTDILRFKLTGEDGYEFDLNRELILNLESLDLMNDTVIIVSEQATYGLFHATRFATIIDIKD